MTGEGAIGHPTWPHSSFVFTTGECLQPSSAAPAITKKKMRRELRLYIISCSFPVCLRPSTAPLPDKPRESRLFPYSLFLSQVLTGKQTLLRMATATYTTTAHPGFGRLVLEAIDIHLVSSRARLTLPVKINDKIKRIINNKSSSQHAILRFMTT